MQWQGVHSGRVNFALSVDLMSLVRHLLVSEHWKRDVVSSLMKELRERKSEYGALATCLAILGGYSCVRSGGQIRNAGVNGTVRGVRAYLSNTTSITHSNTTHRYAAFFMFLLWQFGFSLFYCLYNKFRFDRAFYYSAQAGLSVGFGALSEEFESGFSENEDCTPTKHYSQPHFDFSKFVTILNVLLGSSVIGGALGFFIDSALEKQSAWFEQEDAKARHDAKKKELEKMHQSADLAKMWIEDFYEDNRTEILLVTGVFLFIVAGVLFGTFSLFTHTFPRKY